jgi:hypothetical protein
VYFVSGVNRRALWQVIRRRIRRLRDLNGAGIAIMDVRHGDLEREQAEAEEREERDGATHGERTIHVLALRFVPVAMYV